MRPRHHPIEYRVKLPLRPRTDNTNFLIWEFQSIFHLYNRVFWHLDRFGPERHLDVINHRKSRKGYLAPPFSRFRQNQLNTRNLGRETGNNHSPTSIMIHHPTEVLAHIVLRMWMVPRRIDICWLIYKEVHPFFCHNLINPLVISLGSHRMRLISPVTREIDQPIRRPHDNRSITRNRVQSMNKFHWKILGHLDFFMFKRIHRDIVHLWSIIHLCHLLLNHSDCKGRAINRRQRWKFRKQMFASSNVIQMRMGKANRFHLRNIVFEIFNIWNQIVHPRIIIPRKQHPHINNHHLWFILNDGHIFTNPKLTHTPNRDNLNRFWVRPHLFEFSISHLFPVIAVVARFIHRHPNNMLGRLRIHILRKHPLMMHHITFFRWNRQVHLALLCRRLFGNSFGRLLRLIFSLFWDISISLFALWRVFCPLRDVFSRSRLGRH